MLSLPFRKKIAGYVINRRSWEGKQQPDGNQKK
jgi:hypothetical protein